MPTVPAYPHHDQLAKAHILALLLFVVLAVDVAQGGPLAATDAHVGGWVEARTGPTLEWFGREVLSAPGHTEVTIVLVLVGFAACMHMGVSRNAWTMVVAGALGVLLVPIFKIAFDRPRPSLLIESGAFPSGHAFKAVFAVGLVFALTWDAFVQRRKGFEAVPTAPGAPKVLAWVWLVGIAMTMAGRVVGNVHWWTDTLGGGLLGLVLLTGVLFLHATLPASAREEITDDLLVER